jgi:hypothetical protein
MVRVCKFWYELTWYELTVVRVDYNRNYSAILATLLIFYLQGSENGRIVTIELTSYRHILIYPAMTAFTDQYSLPNIFFDIGQL